MPETGAPCIEDLRHNGLSADGASYGGDKTSPTASTRQTGPKSIQGFQKLSLAPSRTRRV